MKIALIYGGKSCEHDISVITACQIAHSLKNHELYRIYADRQNKWWLIEGDYTPRQHLFLKPQKRAYFKTGESVLYVKNGFFVKKIPIDAAVLAFHGINGEDGTAQGVLELAGVPYTSAGVAASGLCMDKLLMKSCFEGIDVPVLFGMELKRSDGENARRDVSDLVGFPLIVKPANLGSSIGISVCRSQADFEAALETAFSFDDRVLVEQALTDFYEVNCSAMTSDGEILVSELEKPCAKDEILSFADKYVRGEKNRALREFPFECELKEEIRYTTQKIYRRFNLSGVVRIDYLIDRYTGAFYVNEVNTLPGSLADYFWKDMFSPEQFAKTLIDEAIARKASRDKLTYAYESQVLNGAYGAKGPKS